MENGKTIVGQEPEKFGQKRRIPKLPMIVMALLVGAVGGYVLINSFAATANTNCFATPSACGYPDATNTGVPAGTTLTPSGSITASTNGQVIDGKDVTGTIDIAANNVTVQNTRVTSNTTCGPTNACGNYEIKIEEGVTGAVIKNSELRAASGDTCEHDIRNVGGTVQVIGSYLHGCDSNLYSVGNTTFTDDYGVSKIVISNDHVENIYMSDSTLTVNHSTLFNPVEQTAVIFSNVNGGSGGSCSNHINVTNSFLVGGGYTFYPCGNGSSAGSSSVSITNNRFARCLGKEVVESNGGNHVCQGGADSHGYYPNGGSYGIAAYYFKNMVWTGNIWDDNAQSICADGSNGCAATGGSGGDITPPTVSITAPTKGSTVSGSTTVSANASDDTGVAGVQFKLDGNNLGSEDTASPYTTSWDTSGASNGTHTLTAVARDAAGNTTTSSAVTVTVNNSTGGGGGGGSGGGTQTSNCFPKPSACGYPDATNTGVPAGTALTSSGSITASTNGQVISGKDITGQLVINAPNVTVKDSKIHTNDGGSGSTAIIINNGATNFTLEDSEVYGNGSKTNAPESGVWNHYGESGFNVIGSYIHGSPDNIEGPANVKDSYLIVDAEYSGAHSENIYLCGTPASVDHSTMYNTSDETSLIFGDGICGSGNQVSVTNSLLAGGGWMLQPDSKGVSAPVSITDNRVGRCLGSVSQDSGGGYVCKGGADSNGYWPYGGHYGLTTDLGKNYTWSGNVWDDNSKTICPTQDGTGSCGSGSGGGGGGTTDTTKPTVSIATPATGSTVSGIVTSTANASDNVGVTKVEFYIDGAASPAITDTSSPYNYSFDTKTLSNGAHTITAKAYDAAGNVGTANSSFTVNNPDTTPPSAPSNVKATAASATTVSLTWNASTDSGTGATGVAKYNVLRDGVVIAQVTATSYTDTNTVASTTYSYVIQAVDGAGNVSANSNTASVTTPKAGGGGGSGGGTQTSNCFPKPSACGYPDATNTGVPAGTALTSSGSITASTNGQVINGMDVTGTIVVNASNVTIENTRVTQNTTCGTAATCGNYAIGIGPNASNVTLKNVETRDTAGDTCQQDIRSGGPNLTIENSYLHACDGNIYAVAPTTVKDTYALSKIDIPSDHIENIYLSDTTVNVNHSTFFNPVEQTATIFGNVNGGSGGTCANNITATNNFLVGGGYTVYACAHGTGAGSSSAVITSNRFARCLGNETVTASGGNHVCQGGTDSHGYYPNGGSYGLASSMYSNVTTWSGNIWDDNGQAVCADGSSGCGGSGGSNPDTTPPSTPSNVKATATNANEVTLSWNASTDTGGSGLAGYNIYRDGTKINSSLVTTTSYGDGTVSPSTAYSYKIEAVDGAGNKSAQSTAANVTTPTQPDTTPPTVSITTPSKNASVSGSAVSITASATDNVGVAGVQFQLDGNNLGSEVTAAPYTVTWNTSTVSNGTHTLTAIARDAAGNTKTSASVTVTVNNTTTGGGGSGGTQTTNCFSKPSTCGYPDDTNTGVPPGTTLTPSGSITASTAGEVINAKDVTGSIEIDANNVTVENTRVTLNSGSCGKTTACGNYEIRINEGVTGTVIKNSELRAASGITCEHDIRNTSSGTVQVIGDYLHGCDSNLYNVGNATMTDTYGLSKIDISTDHVENIYFDDSTVTVNHSTLFNPVGQTAVIFGNSNGGSGDNNACKNHLSVSNSLFAGGGFTLYPCAHASTAGSSNTSVTNTHFARCLTTPVYHSNGGNTTCQGGADSHGYYPGSGNYGVTAYYFSNATTWTGNVWDDNGQALCMDGSSGCGGSGGAGGSDTTKPTASVTAPAGGSQVSGIVTATASATDNVGVTKVEFYVDSAASPAMTDTSAPYNYSFDSKTLSNGNHTITVKAYDAAGNVGTASSTFAVNNADTTPPSAPTNVKASASNATTVNLIWNASTDSNTSAKGVVTYNVLRDGAVIAQVTGTSYTDTSAVAGTTYSYIIQAVDGSGNVSANSNTATVTTPSAPDTTPPTTPTGLQASAASSIQVNLTWNASTDKGGSGLAGYNVYRDGKKLNSNLVTSTSYGDTTVNASTAYTYTIEAVDGAGNKSVKSSAANVTTPGAPDTTPPSTPTGLKASAASTTEVDLSWDTSTDTGGSGLAGYNIYRNGKQVNTAPISSAAYKDANVSASTTYQYAVQAVDKAGNTSDKTDTVSVTTPAASTGGGGSGGTHGGGNNHGPHRFPVIIHVYDRRHRPAYRARVELGNQTVLTDQQGNANFTSVASGRHEVTVQYHGQTIQHKVNVKDKSSNKPKKTQTIKFSLTSSTLSPALLLVPFAVLVIGGLVIFRPWSDKLSRAVVGSEPEVRVVSSDKPTADASDQPGHKPEAPGTVYNPDEHDKHSS